MIFCPTLVVILPSIDSDDVEKLIYYFEHNNDIKNCKQLKLVNGQDNTDPPLEYSI